MLGSVHEDFALYWITNWHSRCQNTNLVDSPELEVNLQVFFIQCLQARVEEISQRWGV